MQLEEIQMLLTLDKYGRNENNGNYKKHIYEHQFNYYPQMNRIFILELKMQVVHSVEVRAW